jgi:hypothetical protein
MVQIKDFIKQAMGDNDSHARWLNSLSYLEYRGSRKIMRALQSTDMDDEILAHALEEVRHALFFKRLAIKVGGAKFRHYRGPTLLAEAAIKHYFFVLDQAAAERVAGLGGEVRAIVYRVVTWLIEERALKVYKEYETLLQQQAVSFSLKPVLMDEDRHLAEVRVRLDGLFHEKGVDLRSLVECEELLFAQTLSALVAALQSQAASLQ